MQNITAPSELASRWHEPWLGSSVHDHRSGDENYKSRRAEDRNGLAEICTVWGVRDGVCIHLRNHRKCALKRILP